MSSKMIDWSYTTAILPMLTYSPKIKQKTAARTLSKTQRLAYIDMTGAMKSQLLKL